MKQPVSDFNRDLAEMLGIHVREGYAMTPDGSYLEVFYRDEQGYARPIPDFEGDLNASLARIPRHVQVILRYSAIGGCYCCLLVKLTGELVAEEYDESQARAVALALRSAVVRLEIPTLEAVRR